MIRPGLLLLSYHAVQECKSLQQRTRADGEAISVAAIMEMLHDATLLHDDVIDAGTKRRGLPTVNHLWGNDSAVLLGDFLLSRVLKMSADLQPQIQKLIAAAAAEPQTNCRRVIFPPVFMTSPPENQSVLYLPPTAIRQS